MVVSTPNLARSYDWVSEEVTKIALKYTITSSIKAMRRGVLFGTKNGEKKFVCRPCGKEEHVYSELSPALDVGFIFMYETFFSRVPRLCFASVEC